MVIVVWFVVRLGVVWTGQKGIVVTVTGIWVVVMVMCIMGMLVIRIVLKLLKKATNDGKG